MTNSSSQLFFIVAAYGVTAVLLGVEVWQLVWRSRRARFVSEPLDDL